MLTEIVETRESLSAMTREGTLAGVFPRYVRYWCIFQTGTNSPHMPRQMLTPREYLVTLPIPSAPEHLATADPDGNDRKSVRGKIRTPRATVARGWRRRDSLIGRGLGDAVVAS